MKMILNFSIIFFLSFSYSKAQLKEDSWCKTIRGEFGRCRNLLDCKAILEIVQHQAISVKFQKYLIDSACQINNDSIILCCPFGQFQPSLKEEAINHPNVGLLAQSCGEELYTVKTDSVTKSNTVFFEYPWLAFISYNFDDGQETFECGGVLIKPNYVITTADCSLRRHRKPPIVHLGEYDPLRPLECTDIFNKRRVCVRSYQTFSILRVIVHPEYSRRRYHNDIALLRLDRPADHNTPICLPITNNFEKNYTNENLTVAGWKQENNKILFSNMIYQIKSNSDCQNIYNFSNIDIIESQLCAHDISNFEENDYCRVISGNPLMSSELLNGVWRYHLIGIISVGGKAAVCGSKSPPVFTRIDHYVGWILDLLEV